METLDCPPAKTRNDVSWDGIVTPTVNERRAKSPNVAMEARLPTSNEGDRVKQPNSWCIRPRPPFLEDGVRRALARLPLIQGVRHITLRHGEFGLSCLFSRGFRISLVPFSQQDGSCVTHACLRFSPLHNSVRRPLYFLGHHNSASQM